jgi:hypothetical protein
MCLNDGDLPSSTIHGIELGKDIFVTSMSNCLVSIAQQFKNFNATKQQFFLAV